ncbi:MAG: ATP-binding protein [Pseudomonadota bacterium]
MLFQLPAAADPDARVWRIALPTFDDSSERTQALLPPSPARASRSLGVRPRAGLFREWWYALAKAAQAKIEFVPCHTGPECRALVLAGDADLAGPLEYFGDDRFRVTRPVHRRYVTAISRQDGRTVADAAALKGRRLALVGLGERDRQALKRWRPARLDTLHAEQALAALRGGRADVVLLSSQQAAVPLVGIGERAVPLWFRWSHVFALNGSKLIDEVDRAASELDRELTAIERRWLPLGARAAFLRADERPALDRKTLTYLQSRPTILLGASPWKPLVVQDRGVFDGPALRIVRRHMERSGVTPVFTGGDDWGAVKSDAIAGALDGLGFIAIRNEPVTALHLSDAMFEIPVVAIARADTEFWSGKEELAGKTIAYDPASTGGMIDELGAARLVPLESADEALGRLRSGMVDAWVEFLYVAERTIDRADANDVKLAVRLDGRQGARLAVGNEWLPVLRPFNASISDSPADIFAATYRDFDTEPLAYNVVPRWLVLLVIGLVVMLLILARLLRRENRSARQREQALRRAQLMARVGSFEIHPPYRQVLLDGETPRLLGLRGAGERQPIEEHIRLFGETQALRAALDRVIDDGQPMTLDLTLHDDEPRVFHYELAPPVSVGSRLGIVRGTLRDVTEERERAEYEKTLEREVLELQKLDAIGRLAHGIAHDFNNILAASIGYNELALEELDRDHPSFEGMRKVLDASLRSKDLVRQILAFSRRHTEGHASQRWDRIVRDTIEFLRASLPATVGLTVDLPTQPIWVRGDGSQLSQVLINLVTNAVDAVGGRGHIRVELGEIEPHGEGAAEGIVADAEPLHGMGRVARLVVSDDGPGVDPAIRGRIFDPFFTTKQSDKGSGLGLSIVHGLVRTHGGRVDLVAQKTGSAFVVELPLVEAPESGTTLPVPVGKGGGRSVLLVDDEPALIDVFKRILTRRDFQVTAVDSAARGLELVRDGRRFDVVVTDLTMPDMTGTEFARELKAIAPNLPIVLITGFGLDAASAASSLFVQVLEKPLTATRLAEALLAIVGEESAGREVRGSQLAG